MLHGWCSCRCSRCGRERTGSDVSHCVRNRVESAKGLQRGSSTQLMSAQLHPHYTQAPPRPLWQQNISDGFIFCVLRHIDHDHTVVQTRIVFVYTSNTAGVETASISAQWARRRRLRNLRLPVSLVQRGAFECQCVQESAPALSALCTREPAAPVTVRQAPPAGSRSRRSLRWLLCATCEHLQALTCGGVEQSEGELFRRHERLNSRTRHTTHTAIAATHDRGGGGSSFVCVRIRRSG